MKEVRLWSGKAEDLPPEEAKKKPKPPKIPLRIMVEVLDLDNHLLFVGRVSEYKRGVLTIRDESEQDVPPVYYNTEVKIRYFQKSEIRMLRGFVCGSTLAFWRVDRLEPQFSAQQRSAFRQRIQLKTTVAPMEGTSGPEKEPVLGTRSPCELMDISAGGLLMKCRERFGKDQILVFPEVQIMPEGLPYQFICHICWITEGERECQYGCQFQDMSEWEEDRLLRDIFAIQREEIQERKNRGL